MQEINEIRNLLIYLKEFYPGIDKILDYFYGNPLRYRSYLSGLISLLKNLKDIFSFKDAGGGLQKMQDFKYFLAFLKALKVAPELLEELFQKIKEK